MEPRLDQRLCWPYTEGLNDSPDVSTFAGILGIIACTLSCFLIFPLLLLPSSLLHLIRGEKLKGIIQQQRMLTQNATRHVLMSKAEYVGGHPLIPTAGRVVLGLSRDQLIIYTFRAQHGIRAPSALSLFVNEKATVDNWLHQCMIQSTASIPLDHVIQAGMGRPKSAREVYDEDYGHTIDVYEHSPFLSVVFKLNGGTYRASFQSFESYTPQVFYNQITALKYQLITGARPGG
jgi:hypothetical protein